MKLSDSRPRVIAACLELTEKNGVANYAQLMLATGLSLDIIKYHTRRAADLEDPLIRVGPGAYRHIAGARQDYPVTISVLEDCSVLIERGAQAMRLTQGQAQRMWLALGSRGGIGKSATVDAGGPISVTVLLDGSMKLEAGDEVMDLTPREARLLRAAIG